VHDYVTEVEENPRAIRVSFDAPDGIAVAPDGFDDGVGNGARLDLRTAADDRERIGQDRPPAHVKKSEGFAFFVERAIANDVS
jgi:hypothetical protein